MQLMVLCILPRYSIVKKIIFCIVAKIPNDLVGIPPTRLGGRFD